MPTPDGQLLPPERSPREADVVAPAPSALRRRFLGWDPDPPFLRRAARLLLEESGGALDDTLLALPGNQAGRRLEEFLVEEAGGDWRPPQVLTFGALPDRLLPAPGRVAERIERELHWAAAVRALAPDRFASLCAVRPEETRLPHWLPLGSLLRALYAELGARGIPFAEVADRLEAEGAPAEEVTRWRVLAEVQEHYRAALHDAGGRDPHDDRWERVHADPPARAAGRRVVLIGAAELPPLARATLARWSAAGGGLEAWVQAPEELAAEFDDWGLPLPDAWTARPLDLSPGEDWRVEERPAAQARACAETIARWRADLPPEAITLGVPDPSLEPFLERQLAAVGLRGRSAGGDPLAEASGVRLLGAAGRFLEQRRPEDLGRLLAHPLWEAAVRERAGGDREPLAVWQDYRERILPERLPEPRAPLPGPPHRAARLVDATWELLGPLADPRPQGLGASLGAWREWLGRLLGARELDRERDPLEWERLARLGDLLAAAEAADAARGAREEDAWTHAETARFLVERAEGVVVPEPADPPAIQLSGWLELALDDAEALVLSGFHEGGVPGRAPEGPFLNEGMRARLGLPGDRERFARDCYLMHVLRASRRRLLCVGGRIDARGDPLLPSRLAFLVEGDALVERARHAFGRRAAGRDAEQAAPGAAAPPLYRRPLPTVLPVTSFRDYLQSPYLFYLRHIERLESVQPPAHELDGAQYGTLLHAVLQGLGEEDLGRIDDAQRIEDFLLQRLEELARERFGARPRAAVRLQLTQARPRLERFAREQARHVREGWQVHAVEHPTPKEGLPLDIPPGGEPMHLRGTIDRIDRHRATGAWRIYDYKTGEKPTRASQALHATKGWLDPQLPLYAWILRQGEEEVAELEVGYWNLARAAGDSGPLLCAWSEEDLEAGVETAREVVRDLRAGHWEDGPEHEFESHDPILRAIAGQGLLGLDEDEGEEEDEDAA